MCLNGKEDCWEKIVSRKRDIDRETEREEWYLFLITKDGTLRVYGARNYSNGNLESYQQYFDGIILLVLV